MARFSNDPLDPVEVLRYIKYTGAPNTKEIKNHFGSNSDQVRRACGKLMAAGKVMPIGTPNGGVYYMLVTGTRGKPNIWKARREAPGLDEATPTQKKARPRAETEPEPRGTGVVDLDEDGYPMRSPMEA